MTGKRARTLETLEALTDAFVLRGTSTFRRMPDTATRPVITYVRPECAPDFTIPLVMSDRVQLRSIAEAHGGELPAAFSYRKRCAICGNEHPFEVELVAGELGRLRGELGDEKPEPELDGFINWERLSRGPERGFSSIAMPISSIQNFSDLPLSRANRLWHEGRSESDHPRAVAALEEAIKLYESVPHYDSAAAQARLALAERLVEREPDRALDLIKQALPVLTGPTLRRQRERAHELEQLLAA